VNSLLLRSKRKKGSSGSSNNNPVGTEPPVNKLPNNTSKSGESMKFDAGLFVHLKNESIHNYFKIGAKLGEGSFGEVSLVTHKATGVVRAMKKIKKKSIQQEEMNAMIAEVAIMKDLDHPNIVRVFEFYQDNNWYYLITESPLSKKGTSKVANSSTRSRNSTTSRRRWQPNTSNKSSPPLHISTPRKLLTET